MGTVCKEATLPAVEPRGGAQYRSAPGALRPEDAAAPAGKQVGLLGVLARPVAVLHPAPPASDRPLPPCRPSSACAGWRRIRQRGRPQNQSATLHFDFRTCDRPPELAPSSSPAHWPRWPPAGRYSGGAGAGALRPRTKQSGLRARGRSSRRGRTGQHLVSSGLRARANRPASAASVGNVRLRQNGVTALATSEPRSWPPWRRWPSCGGSPRHRPPARRWTCRPETVQRLHSFRADPRAATARRRPRPSSAAMRVSGVRATIADGGQRVARSGWHTKPRYARPH